MRCLQTVRRLPLRHPCASDHRSTERRPGRHQRPSLSIIGWVMSVMPLAERRKRFGIEIRILADDEALGDLHTTIDDHVFSAEPTAPPRT